MSEETTKLTPITEEETIQITPITEKEIQEKSMSTLPTRPNSNGLYGETKMTPQELKARMDELPRLALGKINAIINGMRAGGDVAKTIKFKNDEDNYEYSLAELFAMIFSANASDVMLSDILKTDVEGTTESGTTILLSLNKALEKILNSLECEYATSLSMALFEKGTLSIELLNKEGKFLSKYWLDMSANSDRIVDKAVTTDKLADRAVATSKLADGAVTTDKLGSDVSDKLNGAFKSVSYNSENGYLTFTDNAGNKHSIDLPLELIVDHGELDKTGDAEKIILYLASGGTIEIPIEDFVDKFDERFSAIEADMGKVDEALDKIDNIQETLIGGEAV